MTPSRPLSVLIVEDHSDVADSLAELLALHGHQVRVARSFAGAIAGSFDPAPDVALLDIDLPDGDGYELARWLTERLFPRPLLIAMTGHPNMEGFSRLERIDHHFVKPADPVRFADLLARHADRLADSGRPG